MNPPPPPNIVYQTPSVTTLQAGPTGSDMKLFNFGGTIYEIPVTDSRAALHRMKESEKKRNQQRQSN